MTKLYHVVPREVLTALRKGDIYGLREFRKTLDGTEQIRVRDTVPMFDLMTKYMRTDGSKEEIADIERYRQQLAESDKTTTMVAMCMNLERTIQECFDDMLKQRSPAMHAMKQLLGEKEPGWRLPTEIAAALTTRRPQLLAPLRNAIETGKTALSNENFMSTAQMVLDYIESNYSKGGTAHQDKLYDQGVDAVRSMIVRANYDYPIHKEAQLGLLDMVEDVIKDIDHNEREGGGVHVRDGQGRGKSVFRVRPSRRSLPFGV